MDIEKMKSPLRMDNLYFSECIVRREADILDGKLSMRLDKEIVNIAEHTYSVVLTLTVEKDSGDDLYVSVTANAIFTFESDDAAKEESLINKNSVAIMFPYLRSQVTLMTSQPNLKPVIIPTINTSNL